MHSRTKKFILIFTVVLVVPTTALTADWLFGWHAWLWQTPAPQQNAQEVRKLYQLREFCDQSFAMEKRLDFVILKMTEKKFHWNDKTAHWESSTTSPKEATIGLGTSNRPAMYDAYAMDAESKINTLVESKSIQVQKLRDRNSRYFEKIGNDVRQYGAEDPALWAAVQAKHDELAQTVKTGEFQGCIDELDSILPTTVVGGGGQ